MAHPPETDGTHGRWALVTQNLMAAYGLFPTEQDAWDFAIAEKLADAPFDRRKVDTVPVMSPELPQIGVAEFWRRTRRKHQWQ